MWLRLDLPDEWLAQLRESFGACEFKRSRDETDPEWLQGVRVVFTDQLMAEELIAGMGQLEWLQVTWAAAYRFFRPSLMQRPIQITSCKGIHGTTFSEFGLACLLALAKQLPQCFAAQAQKRWTTLSPRNVAGQTIGIVGLGTVGTELARKAKALGMRVVATKRVAGLKPDFVDELGPAEHLPALLAQSDFVVLSLPDTAVTEHVLGEAELRMMKPSAYLINLAPKQAIAEDVLVRALREHWIAGAALDAMPREPLPPESTLWELSNVIITPRLAGTNPDGAGQLG